MVVVPGNLLVLLLVLGVALHANASSRRLGLRIVWLATTLLALILVLPLGSWLVKPLEDRFQHPALPGHVDGILVLSGGAVPKILQERGMPVSLTGSARILAAADLARRYPNAKLVFSGGSSELIGGHGTEADVAKEIFRQAGMDTRNIVFESKSANTWENIVFSQKIVAPNPNETWILVTSAFHLPRAVGVAQRLGWKVIPWPSDYLTGAHYSWPSLLSSFSANLNQLELATHEWIGLAAYRATHKTATLLP